MANKNTRLTGAATVVREEDLQDMQELQIFLLDKIDKAHGDGRAYMMAQYVRILSGVNSEVERIRKRFDRENLASHRKAQKDLKTQAKLDAEQQNDVA